MIRYSLSCVKAQVSAPRSGKKAPARLGPSTGLRGRGKATGCGHTFESWFQNSAAFDALVAKGQVTCPACGSSAIEKALMAPSVKTTKGKPAATKESDKDRQIAVASAGSGNDPAPTSPSAPVMASLTPEQRSFVDSLRKMRDHVLGNSENVGKRFTEEARKIHYQESEARSIHGEASIDEAKALAEEGIDVFPIPVLPDDRN